MKVLITGASDDGIGGGVARELGSIAAANGGGAIALSTSGRRGVPAGLVSDLEALDLKVRHFPADLTDPVACRDLADAALEFCDGLDAFISNAGTMRPGKLENLPVEDWDLLFHANVRPTLLVSQRLLPALKESRGSIVAIASIAGIVPSPGAGAYAPGKAALSLLVRQMALEWAQFGIRVNAVAPGMVHTHLTEQAYLDEEVHATRRRAVPLGRIGTAQDMAKATAFLTSPNASYITGQIITVDGGFIDSIYNHVPVLKVQSR